MTRGNFFRLDQEKSLLNKGIAIYRYLPIINEKTDENPIYIEINKHFISFNYHSFDKIHQNIELFHLPLTENLAGKDSLASVLKNAHNTYFDLSEKEKYLNDNALDENKNFKNISYWNLEAFGSLEDDTQFIKGRKKNLSIKKHIIFRKLILDFLFDWEHHIIFKNSPFYDEVESKLKGNFFFTAIAAKAAYYYRRALYQYDLQIGNDISEFSSYDFTIKDIAETEEQWLSIIRNDKAVTLFQNSGGWFKDVETEYKMVFFKWKDNFNHSKWQREYIGLIPEKEKDYIWLIKESSIWFLRRYNLFFAVKTVINYKKKLHGLFYIILILSLIGFPVYMQHRFPTDIPNSITFFTYFFIGVAFFFFLFALFFWKLILVIINLIMPRMIMAITSAWFIFVSTEGLVKSSFDINFSQKKLWLFFLLVPVISFMIVELRKIAPDISKFRLIKRVSVILIVAFIYSMVSGIFFSNFMMKNILLRSGFLDTYYVKIWKSDKIKILDFYSNKNDSQYNDENLNEFCSEIPVNKTRIDYQHIGKKFLYYIYSKKDSICFLPFLNLRNEFTDNDESMYYFLKFIKLTPNSNKYILYQVPFFNNKHINIFPGMLIYRAIFALFMGIFIQLIFEEKPVTEPI